MGKGVPSILRYHALDNNKRIICKDRYRLFVVSCMLRCTSWLTFVR